MRALLSFSLVFFMAASSVYAADSALSARSQRKMARKNITPKAFADVCKKVTPLKYALLKNAWPGHIQRSDSRASGFAFVCGADCPKRFPVSAYYSDGTLAFKLGYYGRWEGNGKPRAYCGTGGVGTCSASSITKAAKRKDGKIYLDFGNKSCRSATPGQRNGSTGA